MQRVIEIIKPNKGVTNDVSKMDTTTNDVFNEVDNMINSVFNRDWNLEPIQSTKWNPAVDVKETDSSFNFC